MNIPLQYSDAVGRLDSSRHYREYYEAHAHSYDQLRFDTHHEVSRTTDWLIDHTQWGPSSLILEVGAGTARHLDDVAQKRAGHYVAVDHNIEQLRHRRADSGLSVCASALKMPIPTGSADGYLAIMMTHQLERSELELFATEARRALRLGGFIFVKTSSAADLIKRPLNSYFPSTRKLNEGRYHSIDLTCAILRASGFGSIAVIPRETTDIFETSDYIRRVAGRGNTMMSFVTDEELRSGIIRLSADLEEAESFKLIHHHTYILAFARN